ncbi:MAG: cytochrome c heme lyase subunit CcmF, partial [Chitinophagaceae bacterium]|nr:cytochrome c heme lyase subunit CcmF [Chitinophagaceae bacterium]
TIFYSNGLMILNKVDVNPKDNARQINAGETAMMLDISVISKDGRRYGVRPGIAISGHDMRDLPDSVVSQGLVIRFNKIADEKLGKLQIGVKESNDISDLLTLKVYQFPWINILWIGVIVMVVGMILSVINRVGQGRKKNLTVV